MTISNKRKRISKTKPISLKERIKEFIKEKSVTLFDPNLIKELHDNK
jgi:hypothetical protein